MQKLLNPGFSFCFFLSSVNCVWCHAGLYYDAQVRIRSDLIKFRSNLRARQNIRIQTSLKVTCLINWIGSDQIRKSVATGGLVKMKAERPRRFLGYIEFTDGFLPNP